MCADPEQLAGLVFALRLQSAEVFNEDDADVSPCILEGVAGRDVRIVLHEVAAWRVVSC